MNAVAGLTSHGTGRWEHRLSSSYQASYYRRDDGSFAIEVRSLEHVRPRPQLIRAQLEPQPTLSLARTVAKHFVDTLVTAELAELEAVRG